MTSTDHQPAQNNLSSHEPLKSTPTLDSSPAAQWPLLSQQVRLFYHLTKLLLHLQSRVPWEQLDAVQRRQLVRLLAQLQEAIFSAQLRINPAAIISPHKSAHTNQRHRKTHPVGRTRKQVEPTKCQKMPDPLKTNHRRQTENLCPGEALPKRQKPPSASGNAAFPGLRIP